MPSWTHNDLYVSGEPVSVASFLVSTAGPTGDLSFGALVPVLTGEDRTRAWGTATDAEQPMLVPAVGPLLYTFDTVSSPPYVWLEAVAARYPRLRFELLCCSPEVGYAGRLLAEDGRLVVSDRVVRRFEPYFAAAGYPGYFIPSWEDEHGNLLVTDELGNEVVVPQEGSCFVDPRFPNRPPTDPEGYRID